MPVRASVVRHRCSGMSLAVGVRRTFGQPFHIQGVMVMSSDCLDWLRALIGRSRMLLALSLASILGGCASLPTEVERSASLAYAEPALTTMGRLFAPAVDEHPGLSGFAVLDTGSQALAARLAAIESAERAIDLQYYIWNSDRSGRHMAGRLLQAADRGVRVRVLLDDMNIGGRDAQLAALDLHPNIEVRIFNPIAGRTGAAKWFGILGDFSRLNRRMHNKTFIADGTLGIAGGRNIGDEYFDLHPETNFRDRDMLAIGPIVARIGANFDAYWNSEWAYPVAALLPDPDTIATLDPLRAEVAALPGVSMPSDRAAGMDHLRALLPQLIWAEAALVYDPPVPQDVSDSDTLKPTARALGELTRAARKEVLIESAYLILALPQLEAMREMIERGVVLRALTNSLASNDVTVNHAGYARTRRAMLEHGLILHEFRPDAESCRQLVGEGDLCREDGGFALHSKSMVIDREVLYVGSFNVNQRSAYLNSETALIVRSAPLAQQIADAIEHNMQPGNSWRVSLDEDGWVRWTSGREPATHLYQEPASSWWRRFKVGLISTFPLEKYY